MMESALVREQVLGLGPEPVLVLGQEPVRELGLEQHNQQPSTHKATLQLKQAPPFAFFSFYPPI
jgi:hypothetical protein